MRLIYTVLFLGFLNLNTYSQVFDYLPAKVGNNQIIKYTNFTLSYNETHEQPDWVAYELNRSEVSIEKIRTENFKSDGNISSGSATTRDYSSTGFDRGHLSPAADNSMSVLQ